MFRYLAWAWDPCLPDQANFARQLQRRLNAAPDWALAHGQTGLQVWVRGGHPGINDVYTLSGDRGVVLGNLFRRADLFQMEQASVLLSMQDTESIVGSGGRALVRDFWGRYVAFLQDAEGRFSVQRDPSGALPCFLMRSQGVDVVFCWLEDAVGDPLSLPVPDVNETLLATHLLCGPTGGRQTALKGITQVLPGERVSLGTELPFASLLWHVVDMARLEPI